MPKHLDASILLYLFLQTFLTFLLHEAVMPAVHRPYPYLGNTPEYKSKIEKYLGHKLLPSQPWYMLHHLYVSLPVLRKRFRSSLPTIKYNLINLQIYVQNNIHQCFHF